MIMNNKTLILLCDQYPLSAGEFFIDDEMHVIAPKFDKVLIYTASADTGRNLNRFVFSCKITSVNFYVSALFIV